MKKVLAIMAFALAFIFASCEDDYSPSELSVSITDFISVHYPNAKIIEAEKEHNKIQVDIIHNNIKKEVVFTKGNEWIYTEWDIMPSALPQMVLDVIAATQYSGYFIDDADFVQKPSTEYYYVELEQGKHEVWLSITPEGTIL